MADWTAPFHMPDFTDDEFTRLRNDYVAEHGHTITIPGLSDIIKIPVYDPITRQEKDLWRKRQYDQIPEPRRSEIRKMKERKRRTFEGMLGSPTPTVVRNAGSIMTAFDDAEDALTTLGVVGRIAKKVAPNVIGKLLTGPVGLIFTAADVLSTVQAVGMYCEAPLMGKDKSKKMTEASPKKMKAKTKRTIRANRLWPTKGELLEVAQTTEQIWGVGLSLGPIMGLIQDIFFGAALSLTGERVNVDLPWPDFTYWQGLAMKAAKSSLCLWRFPHFTDYDANFRSLAALQLSYQAMIPYLEKWHPMDHVVDLENVQIQAPVPTNPLTVEVIEEAGRTIENSTGWPGIDLLWATTRAIIDADPPDPIANLENQMRANNKNWLGYVSGLTAVETANYFCAALEGEDQVVEELSIDAQISMNLLHHKTMLHPNQDQAKFQLFAEYMQRAEDTGEKPTMQEIKAFCNGSASIALLEY